MTVGSRIRDLREARGLSQTQLADRINVSKQTLYKYENNIVTNIPSDKIEDIARALEATPAYLMGWAENESSISEDDRLEDVYFNFAKDAQDDGIDPEDIKTALEIIKKLRGK